MWVSRHSKVPDNCKTDELARLDTIIRLSSVPLGTCGHIIDKAILNSVNYRLTALAVSKAG